MLSPVVRTGGIAGWKGASFRSGRSMRGQLASGRPCRWAPAWCRPGKGPDPGCGPGCRGCGSGMASSTSSRTAEPKWRLRDALLDGRQQVGGLVLLDLEVGVARDAEGIGGHDLQAGEEQVEVGGDHLLEPDEVRGRLPRSAPGSRSCRPFPRWGCAAGAGKTAGTLRRAKRSPCAGR